MTAKRWFSLLLCLCMVVTFAACGGAGVTKTESAGSSDGTAAATAGKQDATGVFMAGFGRVDITPKDSVPMASYGDDRMSTGMYSYLEARSVVVKDPNGDMLVFAVGDVSWCPNFLGKVIRADIASELNIPQNNIILSGTHTHGSVSTSRTDLSSVTKFNDQYIAGMKKAILLAVEDLKPAEVYEGSVMTEHMNHVRRYFMDDGSLDGDNAYGTGTKRVAHETEADGELQVMKFVREGGKDIVITNFQAHPHLEGKTTNLSAQTVGTIRDAVEKEFDALALHWQGAAGNLNTQGSLEGEVPYEKSPAGEKAYGEAMAKYIKTIYDSMNKVDTGYVQVREVTYTGKTNHMYDHMLEQAKDVVNYFKSGNTAAKTATYAHQFKDADGLRINSYFHASRIVSNSKLGATQDMTLYAWSFGDIGGVVLPYEMFDTSGMQIKSSSPFARTFIVGYSFPSYVGYIPTEAGYANGGYESDNSTFAPGTAEGMVENYLNMLNDMHK